MWTRSDSTIDNEDEDGSVACLVGAASTTSLRLIEFRGGGGGADRDGM